MKQITNYKITELGKDKVYYISMPASFEKDEWLIQAATIKKCFDDAGIKVIIGPVDLDIKEVEKYANYKD